MKCVKSVKKIPSKNYLQKKGALNLTVEAIIIFVLAFAMLGVGIFITDQLKANGGECIIQARGILEQIGETPTADKPLVGITKEGIDLPYKEEIDLYIGYYNSEPTTAEEATVLIDDCKSITTGVLLSYENNGKYPVQVVGSTENVGPCETAGLIATLTNNNLESGEKYICKLKIVKESEPTIIYYSITRFVNVIK